MGSADVLWLNMDRPTNLMVIVSVVLLESVPDWDRVLDLMRTRILEPYPVFSQRPVRPRRTLGRYHWEDDPDLDLARHVRRATLSGKGTAAEVDAELQAYIEEHLPHPFDRSRPLWEVHLVDGHGSGAALVFRIHHALADGIALTRVLLGLTEDAAGVPGDRVGPPAKTDLPTMPLRAVASSGAIGSGVRLALASARSGWDHLRDKGARATVTDAAGLTLRTGQVVSDLLLTTNPASAVGGVPGQRKRLVWTQPLPLPGLKQVGGLVGATLTTCS
jgi:hypothetical protein